MPDYIFTRMVPLQVKTIKMVCLPIDKYKNKYIFTTRLSPIDITKSRYPRKPSVSLRLVHDNEKYIMRLKVTINIMVYIISTESTIAKSFHDLLILLLVH